jgi:hypothetical protein
MRRLLQLVFSSLLFIISVTSLSGQSPTGTITGTVVDGQGARVVGVKISARQRDTNLSYTTVSTSDGSYAIGNLPVGYFEVAADMTGFKTFRQENVLLQVDQRLRIDIALEIGSVNESVVVTAEVSRLRTEDSSLGEVVERQRIEQLPLNGRDAYALATLVPGVLTREKDADGFADSAMTFRINGGPSGGSQILMDGGTNVTSQKGMGVVPQADAVEEFRVETNSLKAEHGQTSGGVISVVTKSGTNVFHGSLYEFFRNDALDARNAFSTQIDPSTGRIKPVLRYNQFGGTAGGPVLLPKLYNGRNRTFFFAGYEQWRYTNATLMRATLPTAAERAGDFTRTLDSRGQMLTIYDPETTRPNPNGAGYVRSPFPGNVIPSARFDPVSASIFKYVPLPDVPANNPYTNTNNWLWMGSSPKNQATGNIRIDHRFSDMDNLSFRYARTRQDAHGSGYGFGVADPNTLARNDQRDRHNVTLSETHIFTPTMTNEFRANVARFYLAFQHPSAYQNWPQKLGMSPNTPQDLFPSLSIGGVTALGPTSIALGLQAEHTIQFADAISMMRAGHLIKAGVEQRFNQANFTRVYYPSGQYQFTTTLTNNPQATAGTGYGFATYLLGQVTGGQLRIQPPFGFRSWVLGTYVQDDWKVTPRLTLNLGVRYDFPAPPVERQNLHSNFEPGLINPQTGLPGVMTYAGVTAPSAFVDSDRNNFGPRAGFAYALNSKTVIRGGYGIFYLLTDGGDVSAANSNMLGFESITSFVSNDPQYKAFQFKDGPPDILQPLGAKGGPTVFRGQLVRFQDRNSRTPYVQQWNFTVQRHVYGHWLVSASYAGNRGVKLYGGNYNLNQLDPRYFSLGLSLQNQVPNPYYGQITSGALALRTITRTQSLLAYPDYLEVDTFANHGSSSIYHSLQMSLSRRYSSGVTAMFSYTNGKLIDDSASVAGSQSQSIDSFRLGAYNRRLDRALDEFDVSQRFVASALYELPFAKRARPFLKHSIGGWQLNTVASLQTGYPLDVRGASNYTNIDFPDVIRDPTLPASKRSANAWFDTDAFRNPQNFVVGNAPRTLPNTRGPGLISVNASVFKNFRLKEKWKLEYRTEFFNVLNHVNLNDPNLGFSPNAQGLNASANFGRITSSLPARRLQLALRITF